MLFAPVYSVHPMSAGTEDFEHWSGPNGIATDKKGYTAGKIAGYVKGYSDYQNGMLLDKFEKDDD